MNISDSFTPRELMRVFGINFKENNIEILDFILSCRSFGKNIENTMKEVIKIISKNNNKIIEKPNVIPSEKNIVCQEFFESLDVNQIVEYQEKDDGCIFLFNYKTHLISTHY